jgi:hypothetical protein
MGQIRVKNPKNFLSGLLNKNILPANQMHLTVKSGPIDLD